MVNDGADSVPLRFSVTMLGTAKTVYHEHL